MIYTDIICHYMWCADLEVSSQQIFGSAEMFEVKAGQAGAIQFATGQPFHCNWYSRHWKGFEPPTHGMSNSMVSTCCSLSSSTSTCTDCNAKTESKEACELWTQKHHVASARNMLIPSRAWETNCLESNLRKDMQKKQNLTMYQQFLSNNVQKNLEAPWRISEYQRSRLTHEDIMIIMPSSHNERWRTSPTLLRGEIPGHWWCQLLKARK